MLAIGVGWGEDWFWVCGMLVRSLVMSPLERVCMCMHMHIGPEIWAVDASLGGQRLTV